MAAIDVDEIRARFSAALSDMYRAEVPLYGDLLGMVASVNANADDPERGAPRIEVERHGAIRLGLPAELALIGRLFAVMGMRPVGYYDLAPSGIPVHSTAFRPTTDASLARNPFRMFTSLLRLELIEDAPTRAEAERILAARRIMTTRAVELIELAEAQRGLAEADADELVDEALETFRWNQDTAVDRATYDRLHAVHPLVADVVCFRGPHVNHLTPRTFDIDAVHAAMTTAGMDPKATIEGPPRRAVPILLRQTSFKAREETIRFAGSPGTHTARFGEVEQRGFALTPSGRALYDRLLATGEQSAWSDFPDDEPTLRSEGLLACGPDGDFVTYEDFLPVSAAGIFRSNLGRSPSGAFTPGRQESLERALGMRLIDPMALVSG